MSLRDILRRDRRLATLFAMQPLVDRADVEAVLSGLFHANARLQDIEVHLRVIRYLLDEGDEEEEEDPRP